VIEEAGGMPVAILNHNRPAAYLVPAEAFEAMLEKLEDLDLAELVRQRRGGKTVKVSLDDL
jgi:antitoxin StbD